MQIKAKLNSFSILIGLVTAMHAVGGMAQSQQQAESHPGSQNQQEAMIIPEGPNQDAVDGQTQTVAVSQRQTQRQSQTVAQGQSQTARKGQSQKKAQAQTQKATRGEQRQSQTKRRTITEVQTSPETTNAPDHAISGDSMVGIDSSKSFDKVKYIYEGLIEQPSRGYDNNVAQHDMSGTADDDELVMMPQANSSLESNSQATKVVAVSQPATAPVAYATNSQTSQVANVTEQPQQPMQAPSRDVAVVPTTQRQSETTAAAAQPAAGVQTQSACHCPEVAAVPVKQSQSQAGASTRASQQVACSGSHGSSARVWYSKKNKNPVYNRPGGNKIAHLARGDHFLPGAKQGNWIELPGHGWVKGKQITTAPIGRYVAKKRRNH